MNQRVEMNRYPQLTVIMALVGGLVLANPSIFNESFAYTSTASTETTVLGHFTLILKDEFGNIKDYREFDNHIVNEGDSCIANLLFTSATGSACGGLTFNEIGVSDCSDGTVAPADDTHTPAGNATCDLITDATNVFDELAGTAANFGDFCEIVASNTYTTAPNKVRSSTTVTELEIPGAAPNIVREAGILNDCAVDQQMLAIQSFADVTLNTGDSLTINYDISFSG